MDHLCKPKIRNISIQRMIYRDEPVFLIQDNLKLTETAIVLPQVLGPLLLLCDGLHTTPEIAAALEVRYGLQVPPHVIYRLLDQFNQALLLEGEIFEQAKQQAVTEYRSAPFRPPALAGASYPADSEALRQMLQGYLSQINGTKPASPISRGVISPHIDYQRGGPIYAQVWASVAEAARQAELIIIFGTDHNGGYGTITLTPQNYATPLGVTPTDKELVNRLAEVLGPENVFADELHHHGEHSIELALVWLQYIRQEQPCQLLPVLCGAFHHFMTGQTDINAETKFKTFVKILQDEMTKRRTLVVAAGDLAHLGPAFDTPPLDSIAYAQMEIDDAILMETLTQGNAEIFFKLMQDGQHQRNVCGFPPFYFTLDTLGQTQGQVIAYDRCPADHQNTSFVSICGMVLE